MAWWSLSALLPCSEGGAATHGHWWPVPTQGPVQGDTGQLHPLGHRGHFCGPTAPLGDPVCRGAALEQKGGSGGREESPSQWWALTTPAQCLWCSCPVQEPELSHPGPDLSSCPAPVPVLPTLPIAGPCIPSDTGVSAQNPILVLAVQRKGSGGISGIRWGWKNTELGGEGTPISLRETPQLKEQAGVSAQLGWPGEGAVPWGHPGEAGEPPWGDSDTN